MTRFHISLTVADLDTSVGFYTQLFAAQPTVRRADYAKWMLDDPRINFSLSTHGSAFGIDHIGLQVDHDHELADLRKRAAAADAPLFDQEDVECCYAQSSKTWVRDPDGVAWEAFLTAGQIDEYGDGSTERATPAPVVPAATTTTHDTNACCRPAHPD